MVEIINDSSENNSITWDVNSSIAPDVEHILDYANMEAENLKYLIPLGISKLVQNNSNISIESSFDDNKKEWRIMIVENNHWEILTDPDIFFQWQQDILEAQQKRKKEGYRTWILPGAPESVNRLHAKYYKYINEGKLNLNDRVLLRCIFRPREGSELSLCIHDYDWEKWLWIAKDFYLNTLPNFAKKYGFRFIVWDQHPGNITFFVKTLWRYQIEDLKPKHRHDLFWSVFPEELFTFQFLYQEDIEKYILPNRIK